jgi:hypothetical protein
MQDLLILNNWKIWVNKPATIEVYNKMDFGSTDYCWCDYCRNFKAQKSRIYPENFIKILQNLGIDHLKEAEVYHIGEYQGMHSYGGWFHFLGQLELQNKPESRNHDWVSLDEYFKFTVTDYPEVVSFIFRGKKVIQIEFNVTIPWLLNETLIKSNNSKL